MQLEGAFHMNKKQRTAQQAFENDDYFCGIVTTGMLRRFNHLYMCSVNTSSYIIYWQCIGTFLYSQMIETLKNCDQSEVT